MTVTVVPATPKEGLRVNGPKVMNVVVAVLKPSAALTMCEPIEEDGTVKVAVKPPVELDVMLAGLVVMTAYKLLLSACFQLWICSLDMLWCQYQANDQIHSYRNWTQLLHMIARYSIQM